MNIINYRLLADSIDFYAARGYSNIELPWYVTEDAIAVTRPAHITNDDDYYIPKNNKYLVASAEQSFIYLIFKGILSEGYHQGITPCYRFEKISSTHRKCFMKNELIYVDYDATKNLKENLDKIVSDAIGFFSTVLDSDVVVESVPQENSIVNYDIMYKGYELGSYGIRKFNNLFQWVYGTGCAEPRLSIIKKI